MAGNLNSGRKSLRDEIKVLENYAQLSPSYFRVLKKYLESGIPEDEKWAVERLDKAFPKFIPTQIEGTPDGAPIGIQVITFGSNDYLALNAHSPQLDTGTPPVTSPTEPQPVQSDSLAPQSTQDDLSS